MAIGEEAAVVTVLHILVFAMGSVWARSPAVHPVRSVDRRYQAWVARQKEPDHGGVYRFVPALHRASTAGAGYGHFDGYLGQGSELRAV